jgi:hypothetical protein
MNDNPKAQEKDLYFQIKDFMQLPNVKQAFDLNEEGILKYFKFFVGQANKELGLDLEY